MALRSLIPAQWALGCAKGTPARAQLSASLGQNLTFSTCSACSRSAQHAAQSTSRSLREVSRITRLGTEGQRRWETAPVPIAPSWRRHASTGSSPGHSQRTGQGERHSSSGPSAQARADAAKADFYRKRNQSLLLYSAAGILFVLGTTYAAVPLYRVFCSTTGFGGTPINASSLGGGTGDGRFDPSRLVPATHDPNTSAPTRRIRVTFNADTSEALPWSFTPVQKEIYVLPGETALAFFTAKNNGPKDIIGIATYNVSPDRIAPFFAKVECFCFEEQRLLAGEEVDMPVFFFLDVDMLDEPAVRQVKDVVLSYTFFSARRNKINGQLEPDTDLEKYRVGKD
ncbi:Cytochrome c oxidase assembly protein cox11, mitochondrial [Tilletia horrida]|uniref:Cytochrome c oxidase assembly protein cox11, mitochondrial n=1 Tax=Tilletia horrida TaxID=155126 RepID=A0AAN6JVM2_9BASI|nr:Cytochrome c oxidase assembly protein cox11, mitochondrial [Tilletia horrida]KAK0563971.1 Cytochrome c oxidase assembly protein cox11, mitochondrial [Tilletia horrida]